MKDTNLSFPGLEGRMAPMKTRTWILILAAAALLSGILGFFLLQPGDAALTAEIYSGGKFFRTVSLLKDQTFSVSAPNGGRNIITVKDGKIAVANASCPDHYCMHRGFCNSGAPIICLPNAMEIRFVASSAPDLSLN